MTAPEGSGVNQHPKSSPPAELRKPSEQLAVLLVWFPGRNQGFQQAAPQAGLAHPVLAETGVLGMSSESPEPNAREALENNVCREYISIMIWVTPESLQNKDNSKKDYKKCYL